MRTGVLAVALLVGCGQVDKGPFDAPSPDAYQPDAPATCSGGQMLCGTACEDVMSSAAHCGNCDTQCNALEGCVAGACVIATRSCATIKALDPNAVSALYTNGQTGEFFYCDMTAKVQYSKLSYFVKPGTLPTGANIMTPADFDASGKAAFAALYNRQGGLVATNVSGIQNCCIMTGPNNALRIGAQQVLPGQGGATACLAAMMGTYQFTVNGVFVGAPLPAGYFDLNPVTELAGGCSENVNPVWIWTKEPF